MASPDAQEAVESMLRLLTKRRKGKDKMDREKEVRRGRVDGGEPS